MNAILRYIIVDDDTFNNMICKMVIESALCSANVKTFTLPEQGLEFIQNEYKDIFQPTILFLDINMPTLTAWEFMEEYEKFSEVVKQQISIYIVSSSVDQRDKDKAAANKYISGFLTKPLKREVINAVAGN